MSAQLGRLILVRRLFAAILIALFLALATGAMEYLHNREHAREDARLGTPDQHHDENNCAVHAQLHAPALSSGWVPLLVCIGLFVAFLSELTDQPTAHRPITRLVCRGPPALLPISA